jgi:hypothetical protein
LFLQGGQTALTDWWDAHKVWDGGSRLAFVMSFRRWGLGHSQTARRHVLMDLFLSYVYRRIGFCDFGVWSWVVGLVDSSYVGLCIDTGALILCPVSEQCIL